MDRFEVVAPDPKQHRDKLFDMYAKVFTDFTYHDALIACQRWYFSNSHYDWSASRIGLLGERVVTHYGVWDYQMRIGVARVRMGGVGAVGTAQDVRRRGLMTKTALACLQAMREHGYDMTMLFGIQEFYHRFGYVRAWSETDFSVRTSHLPAERLAGRLRRFQPRPRPELAELYNRFHRTVTGTAVRPTYLAQHPGWLGVKEGYLWAGEDGRPRGYVLLARHGGRLDCFECCGDTEEVLRALGLLARRWHCEQVRFQTLPYYGELAKRLRRGYCRTQTDYQRAGGPMARMVNLPTTLGKLTDELSRRLRRSHVAGWRGELVVADARDEAMLRIADGTVSLAPPARTPHAIRGGEEIIQLVLGTDTPEETVEAGRLRLSGDANQLVGVLFPEQRPQLSAVDRY